MTGVLKLDINQQCGQKEETCSCSPQPPGITTSKVTSIGGVTNFTKYTHSVPGGGTFTLSGQLSNGGKIGSGNNMEYVQSIAVYFWNGNPSDPILLGIKRTGDNGDITTSYYGKNNPGSNDWNVPLDGTDELQALDDQNCKLNNAVPFEIQGSQSVSLPKESKSSCIGTKTTKSTRSPIPPPGSDYIVKEYKVHTPSALDNGTKISRVTLNGRPINISLTREYLSTEIRLYSSPVNPKVPIMFELKPNTGNSKWFYSKDSSGTSWQEDAGNNFYSDNQLTEALAKKLDEFTCRYHNGVTVDLSHDRSTSSDHTYCCDEHAGEKGKGGGKVRVDQVTVSCEHPKPISIPYHKHVITGGCSISGIKYNEGGNGRVRMIKKLGDKAFPIPGSPTVHAFYCGEVPKLIYLEGGTEEVKAKWFKNSGTSSGNNEDWTEAQGLQDIKPGELGSTINCDQYNDLVKAITEAKCQSYQECNYTPKPSLRPGTDGDPGLRGPTLGQPERDTDNEAGDTELEDQPEAVGGATGGGSGEDTGPDARGSEAGGDHASPKATTSDDTSAVFPEEPTASTQKDSSGNSFWESYDKIIPTVLTGVPNYELVGLGITNQRETIIAWDAKTGKPLYNAIVWLDIRAKEEADEIISTYGSDKHFYQKTGLLVSTYFSALKLKWMSNNLDWFDKAVKEETVRFGTIDTWLIYNLTGEYVTDITNASRTFLMDINKERWSTEMLGLFGLKMNLLPKILPNCTVFGVINNEKVPLYKGIEITGCAGDQQAACVGQGLFEPCSTKCTFGTGAFILTNTGTKRVISTGGLLCTPCYKLGPSSPTIYALEGSIAIAGAGISWLKSMGMIQDPAEISDILKEFKSSGGVVFAPAFSGLFAPRWRSDARGCIMGMTQHTQRGHIVRAYCESIGLQLFEIIQTFLVDMEIQNLPYICVDGGLAKNPELLQLICDIVRVPLEKPTTTEVTCYGAAILAGLQVGLWESLEEVKKLTKGRDQTWKPDLDPEERQKIISYWNLGIERSLLWQI
ncbi:glycerol kinase family member protein [Theileria equi strain WA]|uniref:glycerol kinase n=1 Tax=Theileria equi strain WA TaxID=1537102 RepID=L0AVS5_THEEQ|nr:glycerol kinase family member protein [Theileria equi strain WA]AFZ79707.1 glycerol kinase family member protein [Theileria equi strain WA]|eukprot:XP_004829373.1 glycerol kinase family member protein [Theileria equi strain WA]